jgi:hypothetical protein
MNCWICGDNADSGEHIIKKSDLKQYIGSVSQSFPFRWYSNNNKKDVGSFKSSHLHFKTKICSKCNNERTQSSDRAWERLSNHIRSNLSDIVATRKLDLTSLAGNKEINQFVVDVQIYFTKLLGCMIHDASVPISTSSFSSSIMSSKPHDSLYLMFALTDEIGGGCKSVYVSDLRGYGFKDKVDYLMWQYSVGELVVFVIYDPRKLERRIIRNSLHPRNHNGKIRFLMKNNKQRQGGTTSSPLL